VGFDQAETCECRAPRRPAPRPRRTTERGVCLSLGDEPQTGVARACPRPPGNPRPRISAASCRPHPLGVGDPSSLPFVDPPRGRRPLKHRQRAVAPMSPARSTRRAASRRGEKTATAAAPPRLARMVVHAASMGEAALAPRSAFSPEPGLRGKDSDLGGAHRWARPRPRPMRMMPARCEAMGKNCSFQSVDKGRGETSSRRREEEARLVRGSLLALAYPDRVAKNRAPAARLLANGRGARVGCGHRNWRGAVPRGFRDWRRCRARPHHAGRQRMSLLQKSRRVCRRIESRDEVASTRPARACRTIACARSVHCAGRATHAGHANV